MRIYQLEIQNFRGIKEHTTFDFSTPLVCLIGLGDSTKSTILDAIEYVLSPNWFIPIDDSDFTNCDVVDEIKIVTTIGPIPESLMSVDKKYGGCLRGWDSKTNNLHDEPTGEDIYVLSVQLTIDSTLTPEWRVVTNREPEGTLISYRDRQKFAVSRIGNNIDSQFAWTRGSSLLRMSNDRKETELVLLEANRKLRELGISKDFESLMESVELAKTSGKTYAIKTDNLKPNIDPKNLRGNASTISLHDGNVPFRRMGLGTRRLMSIGLELLDIEKGAILLVDEIEQALEPHRLKHLLRTLKAKMKDQDYGQIFMTTHSPATLEELGAEPVYCVHYDSSNNKPDLKKIDDSVQGTIRRIPEAFLSPKVIVCEGQTEIGLLRAFEKKIIKREGGDKLSFAYNKTIIVNGEGSSSSPERAYHLATQRYKTCLFIDSDDIDAWKKTETELREKQVEIVRWDDENNTEMQVFLDVPAENIKEIIEMAIENTGKDEQTILQSINSTDGVELGSLEEIESYSDLPLLRTAIAKAAFKKDRKTQNNWFKSVSKAEKLGDYLFSIDSIDSSIFCRKFEAILTWAKDE